MSKRVVVLAIVVAVAALLYNVFGDQLPPRTPVKVARVVSGLAIPGEAEVVVFEDEWNTFNGDGSTLLVLRVPSTEMDRLLSQAETLGFTEISSADGLPDRVAAHAGGFVSMLVHTDGDIANGRTIVIDRDTGQLVVYNVVS